MFVLQAYLMMIILHIIQYIREINLIITMDFIMNLVYFFNSKRPGDSNSKVQKSLRIMLHYTKYSTFYYYIWPSGIMAFLNLLDTKTCLFVSVSVHWCRCVKNPMLFMLRAVKNTIGVLWWLYKLGKGILVSV